MLLMRTAVHVRYIWNSPTGKALNDFVNSRDILCLTPVHKSQ